MSRADRAHDDRPTTSANQRTTRTTADTQAATAGDAIRPTPLLQTLSTETRALAAALATERKAESATAQAQSAASPNAARSRSVARLLTGQACDDCQRSYGPNCPPCGH